MSRGPYGTNEGDIWTSDGSELQKLLDKKGDGLVLIHEVMRQANGSLEECVYLSRYEPLIAEAREGTEKYVAQKASEN